MSQILGIKFSDHGPVCYFSSGAHVVRLGQSVLVETDQGLALGRVATVADSEVSAHGDEPAQAEAAPVALAVAAEVLAPFEDSMGVAEWDEPAPGDPFGGMQPESQPELLADWHADASAASDPAVASPSSVLFASDQATQAQPRPHSVRGLQPIYRMASDADLESHAENKRLARRAFLYCRTCIRNQNLDMKLVDVEVLHDRSKMIFFFTAPNRIDFRELIKSLVREFHTRIELRQIGVRHETQMIGAIGNCGQVCCCRRFLRKFAPVTIKMAKEQNLFLNPAKISGICGRLLCCLSYEQKGYEEFHKQCPKIGKRLQTPIGSVKVLRANFFKKSISVWVEDVGEREFTLDEWKEMLARQPGDAPPAAAPEAAPQGRGGRGRDSERSGSDRGGRSDRSDRPSGSRPSTGRPSRPDRQPRADQPLAEQSVPAVRPDGPERPERSERPDRPDRPDRSDRPERSERPERSDAQAASSEPRPVAEAGETPAGAESERQRPRRKRRKGRGPKPVQ